MENVNLRFEKFQDTKKELSSAEFERIYGIELYHKDRTILDYNGYYIEIANDPQGKYYLILERSEYFSNNLIELEKLLFDYKDE